MERLTQSPYIMDIFGHCGQSSVTEIAFDEQGISNLYRLSAGLRGIDTSFVLKSKLQIAAMTSLAVGHMHSVGIDLDGDTENVVQHPPATIAHNDINPRNVIMAASGIPKLNDFNLAEFLTRTEALQPCGFQSRLHEPWW
jgi:serine/threonine protein kinase